MNRRTKIGIGIATGALVLTGGGIGLAAAVSGDDGISGPNADKARTAAVQAVPGGTAGEVDAEAGEGKAAYGVLVTKSDGSKVEVHLDKNFAVLNTQPAGQDRDRGSDGDGDGDGGDGDGG